MTVNVLISFIQQVSRSQAALNYNRAMKNKPIPPSRTATTTNAQCAKMKIELLVYKNCNPISFSCCWFQTGFQAKPGLALITE